MKRATVKEVEALIDECRGNIAQIARRLGVSRGTIWNRIKGNERLEEKLEQARETLIDDAEDVLIRKVLEGSTPELIFFLKTRGRHRGYTERHEIEHRGKDGGPIQIQAVDYRTVIAPLAPEDSSE